MSHLAGIPDQAPLKHEHDAAVEASGRNFTDRPIGTYTEGKRSQSAELSALVTPTLGFVPDPRAERLPEAPPRRKRGVQRTQTAQKPSEGPTGLGMENAP